MARHFTSTFSYYLQVNSAPLTAPPYTICAHFISDTSASDVMIWLGDKDVSNQYHQILKTSGDALRLATNEGAGNSTLTTSNTITNGTWAHACARSSSTSYREIILDANFGSKATQSTTRTPSGVDRLAVGRHASSVPTQYFDGDIAEVAIWSAYLDDEEVTAHQKGISADQIRPASLVAYYKLDGNNPERNYVSGSHNLSITGATVSDHCRVYYRARTVWTPPAGGTDVVVVPTGNAGTGAVGSMAVTGDANVSATGVAATGQAGAVSVSADANVPITGNAGTGQVGSVNVDLGITANPTGVEGTGQVGSVSVVTDATIIPTGVAGTGQAGDVSVLVPDITVIPAGVEGTGQVGDLTVQFDFTVTPPGAVGTGQAGVPTIAIDGWTDIDDVDATWTDVE